MESADGPPGGIFLRVTEETEEHPVRKSPKRTHTTPAHMSNA